MTFRFSDGKGDRSSASTAGVRHGAGQGLHRSSECVALLSAWGGAIGSIAALFGGKDMAQNKMEERWDTEQNDSLRCSDDEVAGIRQMM